MTQQRLQQCVETGVHDKRVTLVKHDLPSPPHTVQAVARLRIRYTDKLGNMP